jgi:predicted RNA-binding Zn ribbon-like protein
MSGTGRKSDDRAKPLFLGNQLALDFVNTRPLMAGQLTELLPDFVSLLRWFQAAGLLVAREVAALKRKWAGSPRSRQATEAMRQWRERLRKQILAWERGDSLQESMLNELNALMAAHPVRTRIKTKGKGYWRELWFEPRVPEDLFAPVAQSAASLFADLDRKRIRRCPTCVLHFFDTSKKGTRRWCSMQLCGNRLKVAAYAARRRNRNRRHISRT